MSKKYHQHVELSGEYDAAKKNAALVDIAVTYGILARFQLFWCTSAADFDFEEGVARWRASKLLAVRTRLITLGAKMRCTS